MARTDSRAGDTLLGCPSCSSTCSSFAPELPLCRTSEAAGAAPGHVPTTPLLPAALGTGSRAWLCPPGSQHRHSHGSCAQEDSKRQTKACLPNSKCTPETQYKLREYEMSTGYMHYAHLSESGKTSALS